MSRRRPAAFVPTPPLHIAGVGVAFDPGREAALAAVDWRQPAPTLIGVWSIYGSALHTWIHRLDDAVEELCEICDRLNIDRQDIDAFAERPPPARRKRKGARGAGGDKQGLMTADAVGRYRGMGMHACFAAGVPMVREVEPGEWVRALSIPIVVRRGVLVRKKKEDDGLHRVVEASRLVDGATKALLAIPGANRKDDPFKRRIDAAEAILQACAAVRLGAGDA